MNAKIIVATHKKYWMPKSDVYFPVFVGAEGKENIIGEDGQAYTRDDSGENISNKNKNYCELTGLYWAWKNLEADYIGLAHYRRHFLSSNNKEDNGVIQLSDLEEIFKRTDIVLPKKRNYFIETNYNQYVHAHHSEDLDYTRDIIQEKYSEYIKAYDESMKRTSGHRFNMFIMKRDKFDEYCSWMFDILFELERRLDISNYSDYDARVFGFVSERLLDIWLDTNGYDYKEVKYKFMEKQNWFVKGLNFLKRKFVGKK